VRGEYERVWLCVVMCLRLWELPVWAEVWEDWEERERKAGCNARLWRRGVEVERCGVGLTSRGPAGFPHQNAPDKRQDHVVRSDDTHRNSWLSAMEA